MRSSTEPSISLSFANILGMLRHESVYVLWALMEISIITPVFLAMSPWTFHWPPGLVVILLMLVMLTPLNLVRFMNALEVELDKQRTVIAIALIIAVLIAWRALLFSPSSLFDMGWIAEFLGHLEIPGNPYRGRNLTVFILIAFIWWRGISLVGRRVDIDEIGFRIRLEILILTVFVAVIAGSLLPWSVTPFILLFIMSALLALVFTRVEQLESAQSGISFPFTPRWLFMVIGASAFTAFLTGAIAGAISGESLVGVLGWFSPFWNAISSLVIISVLLFSYLLSPLIWFLTWLFEIVLSSFGTGVNDVLEEIQLPDNPFIEQLPEQVEAVQETSIQFPVQLLNILVMLAAVFAVSLILGRLALRIRSNGRAASVRASSVTESHESGEVSFADKLLNRISAIRRWRTAASVRQIYRRLCTAALNRGYPRSQFETPYEYMHTLIEAWPENSVQIQLITEAYVRAHYGELPDDKEELATLSAALKKIEETAITDTGEDIEKMSIRRT